MSLISKMRKQTAIYWEFSANDEYGKPQFEEPVEIDCRWIDISEEFLDSKGNRQISNSKVYVDRDMILGSILKLGNVADMDSGVDNPLLQDSAYQIRKIEKLPNFKATEFLRTVYL
jgi:hypothetical protein